MKIVCDKCNKEFEPTRKMLLNHKLAGDLTEVYFLCPNCKVKHHVCWQNAEAKNLQKLISKAKNGGETEQVNEYKDKLKACLDKLNNRL